MTTAIDAVAEALSALALEHPDLMLVGDAPGPLHRVAAAWPRPLVPAPAGGTRPAVGVGIAMAGQRAVVILDDGPILIPPPWSAAPVLLTTQASTATALWAAGWRAIVPAWPADVAEHLRAALAASTPCVVVLHGSDVDDAPSPVAEQIAGAAPRVLHRGELGLVVASGAAACAVDMIAAGLARRGAAVTAVQVHTFERDTLPALSPDHLAGAVAVGGNPAIDLEAPGAIHALRRVGLGSGDVRALTEAVLAALPAVR